MTGCEQTPQGCSCTPQCLSPQTPAELQDVGCANVPAGMIMAAGSQAHKDAERPYESFVAAFLFCFAAVAIAFLLFALYAFIGEHVGEFICIFNFINGLHVFFGFVATGAAIWILSIHREYEGFIEANDVYLLLIGSVFMLCFGIFGFVAENCFGNKGHSHLLWVYIVILAILCVAQLLFGIVVGVWVIDSYSVEASTYANVDGDDVLEERWYHIGVSAIDDALTETFERFNGYTCNTYRSCCYTYPREDKNRTIECSAGHLGSTVGANLQHLKDPSSPEFCRLATSSSTTTGLGNKGLCVIYEEIDVVDLDACAAEFCNAGIDGYRFALNSLLVSM
eukprot:SAG31_NODE_3150_length_4617_cov_23.083001_5_plen_337_part_00